MALPLRRTVEAGSESECPGPFRDHAKLRPPRSEYRMGATNRDERQLSIKIVSWNIARRTAPWQRLLEMDADVALLQEAAEPPREVAKHMEVNPSPWHTAGRDATRRWRTAVVKLSDRVTIEWIEAKSVGRREI